MGAAVLGALLTILLAVGRPATALAAIAFVQNLGTAQGQNLAALNIVTTGAVTAGDSIVVSIAYTNGTNNPSPVTCSDAAGNTYATSLSAANPQEAVITVICFSHNVNALPAGSNITVSFGAIIFDADVSASEFSGLAPTSTLDQQATGTGLSTALTTAPSGVTAQASELLVGAIGTGRVGNNFTPGTNGTANTCASTGTPTYSALPSSSGGDVVSIYPEYCIVSAVG